MSHRPLLQVKVMVSGSWFNGLNSDERKKDYEAVAIECRKEKTFASFGRAGTSKKAAMRFHVLADVEEFPGHEGLQNPPRSLLFSPLLSHRT